MDGVDIGRYARVNRAIVDKGVRIPERYQIGFNLQEDARKFTVTESGIVVISKGTILG
jgi:glucose-1-phosphate adenylyltransferase